MNVAIGTETAQFLYLGKHKSNFLCSVWILKIVYFLSHIEILSVKVAALGCLKRVTGRIFKISTFQRSQLKLWVLLFHQLRNKPNYFYKPSKNAHLMTQSLYRGSTRTTCPAPFFTSPWQANTTYAGVLHKIKLVYFLSRLSWPASSWSPGFASTSWSATRAGSLVYRHRVALLT